MDGNPPTTDDLNIFDLLSITRKIVSYGLQDNAIWTINKNGVEKDFSKKEIIAWLVYLGVPDDETKIYGKDWWTQADKTLYETADAEIGKNLEDQSQSPSGVQPDAFKLSDMRSQQQARPSGEPYLGKGLLDESIKQAQIKQAQVLVRKSAEQATQDAIQPQTHELPTAPPLSASSQSETVSQTTVTEAYNPPASTETVTASHPAPSPIPQEEYAVPPSVDRRSPEVQTPSIAPTKPLEPEKEKPPETAQVKDSEANLQETSPKLTLTEETMVADLVGKSELSKEQAIERVIATREKPAETTASTETVTSSKSEPSFRRPLESNPRPETSQEAVGSASTGKEFRSSETKKVFERIQERYEREPWESTPSKIFREFRSNIFGSRYIPSERASRESLPGRTSGAFEQMAPRGAASRGGVLANVRGRIASRFSSSARGAIKEKAKDEVKEKAAGTAVKAVATKVGLASTGVGAVVLAGQLLVKAVTSDKVRDLGAAASILAFKFFSFLSAHLVASGFGLIGGLAGSLFGGPLGFMAGFSGGFMIGLQVEGAINSLGTLAGNFMTSLGSLSFAGVGSSFAAFFGAGFAPVLLAVGGTAVGTLFIVITTVAAFVQPSIPEPNGQAREATFTVKKSADHDSFPNYDGSSQTPTTITYVLEINPGKNPIQIESIEDTSTLIKGSSEKIIAQKAITVPSTPISSRFTIPYTFDIQGPDYTDSVLANLVTVKVKDSTGKEETQKASFAIRINNPILLGQPYGFPASGYVSSLDTISGSRVHYSVFLNFSPSLTVDGGIDIAKVGENNVYSTLDGQVVKSEWRPQDVGGVIYIQSCLEGQSPPHCSGPYIVEFEHLTSAVTSYKPGDFVSRKSIIGQTYHGKLPSTRCGGNVPDDQCFPDHVHYQILFKGANVFFDDDSNKGSCKEGKIEPFLPTLGGSIPDSQVAPPCN